MRHRRPVRSDPRWVGHTRAAALLTVIVLAGWSTTLPASSLADQQARTATATAALEDARAALGVAAQDVERLSSPQGIELRARAQLGYAAPGDILVVLPDPIPQGRSDASRR